VTLTPYYADDHVTLYLGDHEDVLPALDRTFDLIVADPPYGETSLDWDRWPDGWPALMAEHGPVDVGVRVDADVPRPRPRVRRLEVQP
jgi:methylase of polypeptide subunit release factors